MPDPDVPVELYRGPHDGLRLMVYPHTHEILMPDNTRYAYRPELTIIGRGYWVFEFEDAQSIHFPH